MINQDIDFNESKFQDLTDNSYLKIKEDNNVHSDETIKIKNEFLNNILDEIKIKSMDEKN